MKRLAMILALGALILSVAAPVSAATPQGVEFDVSVALHGDLTSSTSAGTFAASGAIVANGSEAGEGRFAGQGHLKTGDPNSLHASMTLVDGQGSISIALVGQFGQLPAPMATGEGHWWITAGTGAYAGIAGEGSWTAVADFRAAIAGSGPPVVSFADIGQVL